MTITLDSKSFRDVAKKLDDLAAENQLTKDMYQQVGEELKKEMSEKNK